MNTSFIERLNLTQPTETILACNILNQMTQRGRLVPKLVLTRSPATLGR